MNMNKKKSYVVPEVRIVEVYQENLMNNPGSWNTGSGSNLPIIDGNPGGGSDPNPDPEPSPYAKWHGFNAWDDDIKY